MTGTQMATVRKRKPKPDEPLPDEYCDDGVTKKFNRSRPHGVIYSAMLDEWKGRPVPMEPARYEQDGVRFGGDGIPIDYVPAAKRGLEVVLPPVEELIEENLDLKAQVEALLARVEKLEAGKAIESEQPDAKTKGGKTKAN